MSSESLSQRTSVEELQAVGLFGGIDESILREFFAEQQVEVAEPGEVVFREGVSGRTMYVVLAGELDVLKQASQGRAVRVALLGPHDWFGEMALLDIMPRSATVRAVAPTRLLPVTAADLDRLYRKEIKAYALLMMNLAREISRRLRVADNIVANAIASGHRRSGNGGDG